MALGNSRFGEWASGPLKLGGGDGSVTDISPSGKNGGNYRSFFGSSPGGGGVAFDPSALDSSFNSQPGTGANLGASLSPGGGSGHIGPNPEWGGSGNGPGYHHSAGWPSSGGGYGIGGQGPGGFNQSAGLGFFDDGGEVEGDYSGGNTSQVDPMQIVKDALAYGRQKMGLPAVFHDDPEQQNGSMEQQGFDNGGLVLDPMDGTGDSAQGNGQQPINPQSTIQYLTGTGQLAPEIAEALEQQVDPEGAMDPAERKLMAIAQAPTQDAKFGLMQHYRTRYNAHSGAARAALDQGNLTAAAQHAMQAFHNVPTGMSVKFAPAGRGLAMQASKVGQQGFDQGGAVDVTNPSVLMKQQEKSFERGGMVARGYEQEDDEPADEEGNSPRVDDRRNEDNTDPDDMSAYDAWHRNIKEGLDPGTQNLAGTNKAGNSNWRGAWDRTSDKINSKFYEDGGGVLEEENPEEVLDEAAPAEETPEDSQPVVLSPEQVKAALDPGTYDEALDRGWGAWLQKVMSQGASNLNPMGSAEAAPVSSLQAGNTPQQQPGGLTPNEGVANRFPAEGEMSAPRDVSAPTPQAPAPRAPADPWSQKPITPFGQSTMTPTAGPPRAPAPQGEPVRQQPPTRRPQPKGPAYRNPNANPMDQEWMSPDMRRRGIAPEENAPDNGKPWVPADIADEDNPDAKYLNHLNRVAHKLFPMGAGDAGKREKYISHMYEKYQEQQSKEHVATTAAESKTDAATISGQSRTTLQDKKDAASMERALLSNNGKDHRAAMAQATSLLNNADNNKMRLNGQLLMTDNNLLKDSQKLNSMFKAVGDSLGLSVPAAARLALTMAQQGGGGQTTGGGQPQQPQQQAPTPKVGNPNAAKVGEERPVTKDGKTETWYFGNDGNWHKKH